MRLESWIRKFIRAERAQEYTLLKWALCINNHELDKSYAPTRRWNKNTNRLNESCVFRIMSLKNSYVPRMRLWGFNSLSSQFQRIITHPVLGVVTVWFSTHTSHYREWLGMYSKRCVCEGLTHWVHLFACLNKTSWVQPLESNNFRY